MKKPFVLLCVLLYTLAASAQNQATFSSIVPGMKDRRIEAEAVRVANKVRADAQWPELYYKAVIISHSWAPDLDKNGFLKGRKIHIELLAKMPNGRCAMTDFTFRQKILPDNTYAAKLIYAGVGDLVYVDCE